MDIHDFARRYTAAWCSQDPARVASFFAADGGSLQVNSGPPSVGREAIAETARGFMMAFPDLEVRMDRLEAADEFHAVYHWTLLGSNTGPGGTGNRVAISGYEEWTFDAEGFVKSSLGHFDGVEYKRQLGAAAGRVQWQDGWEKPMDSDQLAEFLGE